MLLIDLFSEMATLREIALDSASTARSAECKHVPGAQDYQGGRRQISQSASGAACFLVSVSFSLQFLL